MSTLYMLVGVPYSGKSTWVENFSKNNNNFVIVSSDYYIEMEATRQNKTYAEIFSEYASEATKLMYNNLDYGLKHGLDIVWDQTNLTATNRKQKLDKIPDSYYKKAVYFTVPNATEYARRIAKRANKEIPRHVLCNMIHSLECPKLSEGFDDVQRVENC